MRDGRTSGAGGAAGPGTRQDPRWPTHADAAAPPSPAHRPGLYGWIDTQRRLSDAWLALWAPGCRAGGASGARAVPLVPGGQWWTRLWLPASAPPGFDIDTVEIAGARVPVTSACVDTQPFCALRRFSRHVAADRAAPILLCAPLAGHHAIVLTQTVQTLLRSGDVYVTDWTDARDVPLHAGRFGLDDDVQLLERYLRLLAGPGVHVVAICQAVAPALAAAALHVAAGGHAPLSLTIVGGPVDTGPNPTWIGLFARSYSIEWMRERLIDTVPPPWPGAGRRVLPGYLQQLGLIAADPLRELDLEIRQWACASVGDAGGSARIRRALDEYAAVLDMDEDYFLGITQTIFQQNRLAAGTWSVAGRTVALAALARVPLFTVEGARDRITGAGQSHAAHRLCRRARGTPGRRATIADCDHYGLFSGPHWLTGVYPKLAAFLNDTSPR